MYYVYVEEGSDYLAVVDQTLIFSEEARYVCFNTTIMNDGNCEPLEFFSVKLSSSAERVLVAPSTGYVIIRDPPLCSEYLQRSYCLQLVLVGRGKLPMVWVIECSVVMQWSVSSLDTLRT